MIIFLFVFLLFFSGCSQSPKIPEVPAEAGRHAVQSTLLILSPEQEKSIGLTTATVQMQTIASKVNLTGRVQAANPLMAHIYSLVPGQATQIPIAIGQQVAQGQALAIIRSDEIGQLEGDLLQAILQLEQELREAQVQLEYSKSVYNREDQLFKAKVSSKSEVESAYAQYRKDLVVLQSLQNKRQAIIKTYQERLSLLGVADDTAERVVNQRHINPYAVVRAPRSGLLVDRNINGGELVDTTKELFQIADLSTVWIMGDVFEKDIHQVQKGQSVEIQIDSLPNQTFKGFVNMLDAMLDPQTRTLDVRVEVPNRNILLKPNMFARMNIITGRQHVLAVPKNAIQQVGEYFYVYVASGPHRYQERQVQVNMNDEPYIEVLKGLQPNEQIVVQGSLELKGEALKASRRDNAQ